jgi:Short C-terminal domain
MGLIAERAAGRMQARQTYRTMARMERRRSFVQSKVGMRQDFGRGEQEETTEAAPASAATSPEPGYVGELERLAQLRDQGILTEEEFEAKKKQLLGI